MMPSISELCCDAGVDKELRAYVRENRDTKEMILHKTFLGDRCADTLARLLALSSEIELIDVAGNLITPVGYRSIAQALHVNSSLRVLHMSNNDLCDVDCDVVDQYFINALKSNPRRPDDTRWYLYDDTDEYPRLKMAALGK